MIITGATAALHHLVVQGGNIDPSPEQARDWLQRELDKPEYTTSLWQRFLDWISSLLTIDGTGEGSISTILFMVLGAAAAGVLAVVVVRHLRRTKPADVVLGTAHRNVSATDFTHRAQHAWDQQNYTQATLDYFRAAATQLTHLGWLRPGEAITTADVTAAVQRHARDPLPATCRAAAMVFDRARYGHAVVEAQQAQHARDLAEKLLAIADAASTETVDKEGAP